MNQKRVALITGAAVGIGRAVALQFAEEGYDLILWDLTEDKLAAVAAECEALGAKVLFSALDVSKEEAVNNAAEEALKEFGRVDALINNAALWRDMKEFMDISMDQWHLYFNINVMGVVHVTRAILPAMIEAGYGRIVNLASVAGVYGNRRMTCYSATKGAVISMTKALAKEVADKGITVNSVSPGTVNSSKDPDETHVVPSEMSYMGRTGSASENAKLICFLASEGASYISGENVIIDGVRKNL